MQKTIVTLREAIDEAAKQNREDWKCRCCNAPGHMQAECRKRKSAEAPLVDRNGKPLGGNNKGVREVESKEDNDMLGHVQQSFFID